MNEITVSERGTRYRILGIPSGATVLIALPDFYWCVEVTIASPPDPGWLAEHKLGRVDAQAVGKAVRSHWAQLIAG